MWLTHAQWVKEALRRQHIVRRSAATPSLLSTFRPAHRSTELSADLNRRGGGPPTERSPHPRRREHALFHEALIMLPRCRYVAQRLRGGVGRQLRQRLQAGPHHVVQERHLALRHHHALPVAQRRDGHARLALLVALQGTRPTLMAAFCCVSLCCREGDRRAGLALLVGFAGDAQRPWYSSLLHCVPWRIVGRLKQRGA